MPERKPYPMDVSDEEWGFAVRYLVLMSEDAPQRRYELRERFNALRRTARAGASWRMLPTNVLPWAMVNDSRSVLRRGAGTARPAQCGHSGWPHESGPRAGHDGHKRKRGTRLRTN